MDDPSELPVQEVLDLACQCERQCRRELERTGAGFNIFDAVAPKRYEQTHSDFLAALLDPDGAHYQGSTFLELFIDELRRSNPETLPPNDHLALEHARVRREGGYQEWSAEAADEPDAKGERGSDADGGGDEAKREDKNPPRRYADLWIDTPRMLMIVELKYGDDPKAQQMEKHRQARDRWRGNRVAFLVLLAPASKHRKFVPIEQDLLRMQYQTPPRPRVRASVSAWLAECRRRTSGRPEIEQPLAQYYTAIERRPNEPKRKHIAMAQDDILLDLQSIDRFRAACLVADTLPAMRARIAARCGDALCRAIVRRIGEPDWVVDARYDHAVSPIEHDLVQAYAERDQLGPRQTALAAIDVGNLANCRVEFGAYVHAIKGHQAQLTYKAFTHRDAADSSSGGVGKPEYEALPVRRQIDGIVDENRDAFLRSGYELKKVRNPNAAIFRIETGIDFEKFCRAESLIEDPNGSEVIERAAELFVEFHDALTHRDRNASPANQSDAE